MSAVGDAGAAAGRGRGKRDGAGTGGGGGLRPYFDRERSERYDRRAASLLASFYRKVSTEVAAVAPVRGHVVDIGTGPGRLLHRLATERRDLKLTGVDGAVDMISVAGRAAARAGWADRITLHVADVAALPLPDASVDVAVSTLSQHEWPDLDAAVGELARVLRPGGLLLAYDFRFLRSGPALNAYRGTGAFGEVSRSRLRLSWHPAALFTRFSARRS